MLTFCVNSWKQMRLHGIWRRRSAHPNQSCLHLPFKTSRQQLSENFQLLLASTVVRRDSELPAFRLSFTLSNF